MNQVLNINGKAKTGWENVPAAGSQDEEAAEQLKEFPTDQAVKDRVELSEEWSDLDWTDVIKKALDRLREQYPSIHVVVDSKDNSRQLFGLAASLGTGTHLVISQEFLNRMGSSAEEFSRCSSVLTGIAKQLAGWPGNGMAAGAYMGESSASFWTADKKQEESVENPKSFSGLTGFSDKTSDKNEIVNKQFSKSATISVTKHYSRLAGARTKGQVQTVMSDAQRSIGNLQMTAVFGDDEDKVKASRALRSLKKLLAKGSRKISRLNKEELAALKKKRAEKKQELKKAELARLEMKKKQAARSGSDHGLVLEGMADEAYIRGYRHYRQLKEEYEGSQMSGVAGLSAETTVGGAVESVSGAGGDISAADVTVSGTISF